MIYSLKRINSVVSTAIHVVLASLLKRVKRGQIELNSNLAVKTPKRNDSVKAIGTSTYENIILFDQHPYSPSSILLSFRYVVVF